MCLQRLAQKTYKKVHLKSYVQLLGCTSFCSSPYLPVQYGLIVNLEIPQLERTVVSLWVHADPEHFYFFRINFTALKQDGSFFPFFRNGGEAEINALPVLFFVTVNRH